MAVSKGAKNLGDAGPSLPYDGVYVTPRNTLLHHTVTTANCVVLGQTVGEFLRRFPRKV